jgi:predicted PurR-regulated permease PerM
VSEDRPPADEPQPTGPGEEQPASAHDDVTASTERIAEAEADLARAEERIAESEARLAERELDPLLDTHVRRAVAQVDEDNPYGLPGHPVSRRSPLYIGFFGGLGLVGAYLVFRALGEARQVLIIIVVSLFLAIGLNPAVESVARRTVRGRPLGRRIGIVAVFIFVVAVFAGIGAAVVPPLVDQSTKLTDTLPDYLNQLRDNDTIRHYDNQYHFIEKAQKAVTSKDFGTRLFGGVVGVGRVVLGAVFAAFTVLVLTLYFTSALPSMKRTAYSLVPRTRRARVGLLGDEILSRIGGYVAGALAIAFIAGTSAYILLSLMNVPFALPLALVIAVTDLIPIIGATIGAVVATTVAFLEATSTGYVVLAYFIGYQQLENYVIYPRVMKHTVDVHPAATIVAALIGGTLLGVVGALIAIPTAAAIQLVIEEVVIPRQNRA